VRRRRLPVALPVLALAVAAVGLAAAPSPSNAATGSPSIRFASPTVVNELVPGFEPDVVQDASQTGSRGRLYSSWPNGFSTTISYLDRSDDKGASFHPTAGSVGGKPFTCVGGGDSELQVSRKDGQLLFADLQGLTNFSTSSSTDGGNTFDTSCTGVTGAGVDRQWIAVDDNGGTSPIGSGPTDGRAYLIYDNVAQGTGSNNTLSNSPVVNATTDGVNYGGCLDPGATVCKAPAAVISAQDDIVGNDFVDGNPGSPRYHAIDEVRGSGDSHRVLFSTCRGAASGTATTAAETAAKCANPTLVRTGDTALVNENWSDHTVASLPAGYVAKSFDIGAIDTAGNVYVTWVQYKLDSKGAFASTGQVELASSQDGGKTWSAPHQLNPPSQPTVIFPWITAGDPGRVDVAWYSAPQASFKGVPGPDPLENGTWDVSMAQSLNALSPSPSFALTKVNDHVVKYGDISTGGLGGSADRSLGDYLQVKTGNNGEAIVSYVDDTSGNRNNDITQGSGEDPPEASGPTMFARQVAGPSLFTKVGSVGNGTAAVGSVTDPVGQGFPDSYLALAGNNTSSSKALDIAGVSITQSDATHLKIAMKTGDPTLMKDLADNPSFGGAFSNWRVRWAGRYGTSGKDGQIYYVGLQAGFDGVPEYYVGKTASIDTVRTKYYAYPTGTSVPGAIKGDTITWTVPTGAVGSPKAGDGLFSVTGFTATSLLPDQPIAVAEPTGSGQFGDEDTLTANQIDAAPSFRYAVRTSGFPRTEPSAPGSTTGGTNPGGTNPGSNGSSGPGSGSGSGSGPGSGVSASRSLASTGLPFAMPLLGMALLGAAVLVRRRRAS